MEIAIEHPELRAVSAWFHAPEGTPRQSAFLLAHGSGADPRSEFLLAIAEGLCARGYRVLSFRYAYMELAKQRGKPRPPDRRERLEQVHERALEELQRLAPGVRPILAGKSLGARISTYLAARGANARGLVLLGYPLHPPGQPERCRSEHFPALVQPALFFAGTRDEFCDLALLRAALATYGGNARLDVLDGADHGFERLRSAHGSSNDLWQAMLDAIADWEAQTFGE